MILLPVEIIDECLTVAMDVPSTAVRTEISQSGCKVYFAEDISTD